MPFKAWKRFHAINWIRKKKKLFFCSVLVWQSEKCGEKNVSVALSTADELIKRLEENSIDTHAGYEYSLFISLFSLSLL